MVVYLIRHAQSEGNVAHQNAQSFAEYVSQRPADPALTELGHKQAQILAHYLQSEQDADRRVDVIRREPWNGYQIDKLFCSPMLRAMQTAQPIQQALGLNPQLWIDLHEQGGLFDYNSADREDVRNHPGMTRSQMEEKFPGYGLVNEITDEGWWCGGKENLAICMGRAIQVGYELRVRARDLHESGTPDVIALISHGTFINCLLKSLLHKLPDVGFHFRHYNTGITRVNFGEGEFVQLHYINRTHHVPLGCLTH